MLAKLVWEAGREGGFRRCSGWVDSPLHPQAAPHNPPEKRGPHLLSRSATAEGSHRTSAQASFRPEGSTGAINGTVRTAQAAVAQGKDSTGG